MQNCMNEDCNKQISISSRPSGYCSQDCWAEIEYYDMFNRRIIVMFKLNKINNLYPEGQRVTRKSNYDK